jgi:hypothetical protein
MVKVSVKVKGDKYLGMEHLTFTLTLTIHLIKKIKL